jgi:hypothetical protein
LLLARPVGHARWIDQTGRRVGRDCSFDPFKSPTGRRHVHTTSRMRRI